MTTCPTRLTIREYEVQGWCFLLSFHDDGEAPRHMLVDFGSDAASERADGKLVEVARSIQEACAGKLHVIAVTQMLPAHTAGFAGESGEVIKHCAPEIVLLPWTEDPGPPDEVPGASRARKAALERQKEAREAMRGAAQQVLEQTEQLGQRLDATTATEIKKIARDEAPMTDALAALRGMPVRTYVDHGVDCGLASVLPGVTARGLDPARVDPVSAARMRESDDQAYWQRVAAYWNAVASAVRAAPVDPFPGVKVVSLEDMPAHMRWFCRRVDAMRGEALLQHHEASQRMAVSTRVALELVVGGAKILLPGSAALPSWNDGVGEGSEAGQKVLAKYEIKRGVEFAGATETEAGGLFREFEIRL